MQSDAQARVTRRLHRRKRRGDPFAIEQSRSGATWIGTSQGSRAISAVGRRPLWCVCSERSVRLNAAPRWSLGPHWHGVHDDASRHPTPHAGAGGRGGSRSQGAVPWVPHLLWDRRFAACAMDREATPGLAQVRRTQSEETPVSSGCDAQVADKADGSSVGVRWSPHRRWSLATARQPGLPVRW